MLVYSSLCLWFIVYCGWVVGVFVGLVCVDFGVFGWCFAGFCDVGWLAVFCWF